MPTSRRPTFRGQIRCRHRDLGADRTVPPPALTEQRERAQHLAAKPLPVVTSSARGWNAAGSVVLEDLSLVVHEGEGPRPCWTEWRRQDADAPRDHPHGALQRGQHPLDGAEIANARPFEINRRGVSLVPEGRRLFPNLTVLDNLKIAMREGGASLDEVFTLFPKLGDAAARQGRKPVGRRAPDAGDRPRA